jgi:hypothetical protein
MKRDELEAKFEAMLKASSTPVSYAGRNSEIALANLGLTIVRLDQTSGFLAKVNIGLGVLVILVGVFQIVIMLARH